VFRKGWGTDVFTGLFNGLLLYAILIVTLAQIDTAGRSWWPAVRRWVAAEPLWAQAGLAIALGDFGVYGIHRLSHESRWLWRLHVIHHSAEEMDWLVAFRFHPIDLFLTRTASLGLPIALNVSPAAMAIMVAVFGWNAWLVHANVRVAYGPLKWLVVSPEFHHWHHGAEREAYDKNFASVVAVWDVIFGTAYLPPGRWPAEFGVREEVPRTWLRRFFYPFRRRQAESMSSDDRAALLMASGAAPSCAQDTNAS